MADEILRSKHAFGALERVLEAISIGKVNSYDILFLKDVNNKPYIGWIEKDGTPVILKEEEKIVHVDELPAIGETGKIYIFGSDGYFWNGTEYINLCKTTDISVFEAELKRLQTDVEQISSSLDTITIELKDLKSSVDSVEHTHEKVKYEFTDVPVGTLVTIREDEIRVMCPTTAVWEKQTVGDGGDANCYYATLKTYAPNDDAVGYIEHLGNQVDGEILTDLKTDKYGRKYQPTWLALASYDETTDTWTYYGTNSVSEKFIGWDYRIDWFNADGVMIASDSIRINLSNEECHNDIEPYYVGKIMKTVDTKIEEKIAEMESGWEIVEF